MVNIEEIINELKSLDYLKGDLSDLGNDIGFVVGKYLSKDSGFDKDSFLQGIKHGLSISDGTHPTPIELENLCPLCLGAGEYHTGGSFGGPVQTYRCSCQNL